MPGDTDIMFERQILPKILQGLKRTTEGKESPDRKGAGCLKGQSCVCKEAARFLLLRALRQPERTAHAARGSTAFGAQNGGESSLPNWASEKVPGKPLEL